MRLLLPSALVLLAAPLGAQAVDCDGRLTQLVVPSGFCVRVLAESIGAVRHVLVHPTGQIVAALNEAPGLVRLRGGSPAGGPNQAVRFGPGQPGTGVAWRDGWLYFAADIGVIRYRWPARADAPDPNGEWIARNLPAGLHGAAQTMKGIAVGADGMVYVSIGSESDNCQVEDRGVRSPGRWPCAELERRAGVWRFAPPAEPGGVWPMQRFATGLRNAAALAIDQTSDRLWAATMGRDNLSRAWDWPDSVAGSQPAELLEQVVQNGDYGWPYCQGNWSRQSTTLVRTPDYATQSGIDCSLKTQPVMGFPGHWSPMAIASVTVAAAPLPRPGLLIAFHGPRGRTPLPEDGHVLVFVPLDPNGRPAGAFRVMLHSSGSPGALRPAGVAVAMDGSIYVTDDEHRRILRIEPHPPGGR